MADDMAKRTLQYVQIRDKIKEIKERHKAELGPLLAIQEQLAGLIRAFMDANGLENLRTENGSCYTTTRYTASLADPDAFMEFVKSTGRFELLDRRANATAVRDYVAEHNELPTGCNLSAIQELGVRRAK